MIVYPAIDILDGQVVRMTRGDFATVEEVAPSPMEAAKRFVAEGAEWIHIVDLDGARTGTPANLQHIRAIANRYTVQLQAGGGIRDFDTAEAFAEAGVFAVDARNGMVAAQGWTETTDVAAADLARDLAIQGVPTIIYTNVSVDGTLQGVDLESTETVARAFGGDLIYSGGVGSVDDVTALAKLRHRGLRGVIVGRAIYLGRFTLAQAIAAARA